MINKQKKIHGRDLMRCVAAGVAVEEVYELSAIRLQSCKIIELKLRSDWDQVIKLFTFLCDVMRQSLTKIGC